MPTTPPAPAEPLLITDLPLIRKYAHRNEDQDWRFRTYLKEGLSLSSARLDGVVRETTDAVWAQIDCVACNHCCRSLQIVIDDRDIARLARRFGMTIAAFSQRYVAVAEDSTKHFTQTPCPFLGGDGACTVYEDRPQSCRDFPYLYESNFRGRTISAIENTAVCPIVFNVWQRLRQRFPMSRRRN